MPKPLLNIKNPKPISPGGAYWLTGLEPQVIGNRNQLRQNWQVAFQLNSQSSAGLANLQVIKDICSKKEHAASGVDVFYGIGNQYISRHRTGYLSNSSYSSIIHTINDDGDLNYCAYPGILNTEQGNMLYTSEQNLGKAYYGYHKTGTQTTKIIDGLGRDLSALNGLTVQNIKDASTATITSVSTTNSVNDTLNFAGGWSDVGSIDEEDEWVVFVDTFKDLNTVSFPHFGGQLDYSYWSRQIINFDGDYFIGHGNYIAKLNNNESDYTENYTQLLPYMQFNCMEQVGNNVLIGGERNGRGVLLLWDGVTVNKYQSIVALSNPVYAIKEYRGAALMLSGSSIYWTDGYSVKRLSSLPGTDGIYKLDAHHSSMVIDGNFVHINSGFSGSHTDDKLGIWIYDILNNTWTYNPFETSTGKRVYYGGTQGSVFALPSSGYNLLVASYITGDGYPTLATVSKSGANNFSMAVFSYTAPKGTKINYAELVLGQTMNTESAEKPSVKVTMALSEGRKPFWMYGNVRATASNNNEIPVDGSSSSINKAVIGDMVMMLEGASAGEYAFITGITNQGTSTELWTLDRNLTSKVNTSFPTFQIINCKKMGEHTITDYFNQPLLFSNGLEVNGDFYIIIIVENTTGNVDIRDISIF